MSSPMSGPWCCICFWSFPVDQFYVDPEGIRWDICIDCERRETDVKNRLLNGEPRESVIANPLPMTEGEKKRYEEETNALAALDWARKKRVESE